MGPERFPFRRRRKGYEDQVLLAYGALVSRHRGCAVGVTPRCCKTAAFAAGYLYHRRRKQVPRSAGSPTEPDIVTFPCTGHPDQLWTMTNKGELVNQNNQCIGVEGAKVARGTKLVGFRCDGTPNQRWLFNPGTVAGRGIFVNGANSGLCMTRVETEKLGHVMLSDCNGEDPQQWATGASG